MYYLFQLFWGFLCVFLLLSFIAVPLYYVIYWLATLWNKWFPSKEQQKLEDFELRKERNRQYKRERIKELEPLARKGDLIAFQEWQRLTGKHTTVGVNKIPDMEFTSIGIDI